MENSDVEELRREVARLSAELDYIKAKLNLCYEAIARLREEVALLRRIVKRGYLREYIEALKTYDDVGVCEHELP